MTEYRYHDGEFMSIIVELFTEEELRDQVKRLLQAYRHFHLRQHRRDGESEVPLEERVSEEERREGERKAKLARDTFRAMFRGRLTSEDFLLEEPEEACLRTLTQWIRQSRPSSAGLQHSGLVSHECSARLMELSSERQDRNQIAPWPFIKAIK